MRLTQRAGRRVGNLLMSRQSAHGNAKVPRSDTILLSRCTPAALMAFMIKLQLFLSFGSPHHRNVFHRLSPWKLHNLQLFESSLTPPAQSDTTSATNSFVAELAEPRDLEASPLFKSVNHTLSSWRKVTCDFVSEGPVKMGTLHLEDPEDKQGTTVSFGFGIIPIAPQSKGSESSSSVRMMRLCVELGTLD